MTTSAEPYDEVVKRDFRGLGRTVVREGELLRHPTYTRFLHWTVAIFFFAALLSGLAVYSPWTFRWLAPLFGGGPMTRFLHPWFGVGFAIAWFFPIPELARADDVDRSGHQVASRDQKVHAK
jgi:formate dehydrogenase subunit gamma